MEGREVRERKGGRDGEEGRERERKGEQEWEGKGMESID